VGGVNLSSPSPVEGDSHKVAEERSKSERQERLERHVARKKYTSDGSEVG
jgi:hypothetical protein